MVKADPRTVLYAGAALAGLAAVWYVKKNLPDMLNPFSPQNVASRGAETIYKYTTGSNGSLGSDAYDFVQRNQGAVTPTSGNNLAYRAANSAWQTVGVLDEHETIGSAVYDGVQWFKKFF